MRFSKEEKTLWLEDWQKSGKSAWIYARENGLCPQTFVKWTKINKEDKPCFVELPIEVIPQPQYTKEILIEKGDVRIYIPMPIGCGELRAIFGALGD
jgi:hypothetical protein